MKVFDWYLFKNLAIATVFVSLVLAVVIFLTQSLRFLELVIESGASSISFWIMTFLAMPRFFEIIVPLGLMAAIVFVYNRMSMDSELVALRSVGRSPFAIARPAIVLALIVTVFLWSMTMWAAPKSLSNMLHMRQVIKAQFTAFFFQEGVFNRAGNGLTIYIRDRDSEGEMRGLMIHDSRKKNEPPSTILAKRGVVVSENDAHQVLVYDGSRQQVDPETGALQRLNFERYTIDLPDGDPIRQRWREPEERTLRELLNPNIRVERDMENLREFRVEIHKRFVSPVLALVFTLMSCAGLLIGPVDRRDQGRRIVMVIASVVTLQGLFLAVSNLSRQTDWGVVLMYVLVFVPVLLCSFLLSGLGERLRRRILYPEKSSL